MPYVLEKISSDDQAKILADADCDPRKKGFLLCRGGHFANNPDLSWAIDRKRDIYLFYGPTRVIGHQVDYYSFYFKKNFYSFHINSLSKAKVFFDDSPAFSSKEARTEIQEEVRAAFSVYGIYGVEDDRRPFSVVFEEEA